MSYGRDFKKDKKTGKWRNKKTGQFTSEKFIKGANTMSKRYKGSQREWHKKLVEHYRQMKLWEDDKRYTEPILEYE